MATLAALSNFISFLSPSKPSPRLPSSPKFSQVHQNRRDSFSPLVACLEPSLSTVMCPSLAYSNILFFSSGYNVQVIVDENEPEERLLSRFRREVMKAGVIQECKRRRFFENKHDEKKRKAREAAKRNRRRRPQSRIPPKKRQDATTTKMDDDDEEDNWELPEGNIPYSKGE